MARYAVVDEQTGEVKNLVEWDGESAWAPPEGCVAVLDRDLVSEMRGSYDGEQFYPPPAAVEEEQLDAVVVDGAAVDGAAVEADRLAALEARIAALEAAAGDATPVLEVSR